MKSALLGTLLLGAVSWSSQPASAQATYIYTGNQYNFISGGPPGFVNHYNTSMRIQVTLQFAHWLPPNSGCIIFSQNLHLSTGPAFKMTISDGVFSVSGGTGIFPVPFSIGGAVSTGADGEIKTWSLISSSSQFFIDGGASTLNDPAGTCSFPGSTPGVLDNAVSNNGLDRASIANSPGTWSFPPASVLISMLANEFQTGILPDPGKKFSKKLAQISDDIRFNSGLACHHLKAFVNQVKAQSGKKLTAQQAASILKTVALVQGQLNCASGSNDGNNDGEDDNEDN